MDCIITSDSCSAQTRQAPQASDRRKTMENETELVGCLYVDGIVSTHEPPEDVAAHNNDETSVFPEHLIPSPWKRLRFVFHDFALIPYDAQSRWLQVKLTAMDTHGNSSCILVDSAGRTWDMCQVTSYAVEWTLMKKCTYSSACDLDRMIDISLSLRERAYRHLQ